MPTTQELKNSNTQVLLNPSKVVLALNFILLNTHKLEILDAQEKDPYTKDLVARLLNEQTDGPSLKGYLLKGETLLFLDWIYVPQGEPRIKLLRNHHNSELAGHPGRNKTLKGLQRNHMWPKMKDEVMDYLKGCETLGRTKVKRSLPEGLLKPLDIPQGPWKLISMDYIVELPTSNGYNAILVIVDQFTKMAYFLPTTTNCTTKETIKHLHNQIFTQHGIPSEIITDRGPQFTSHYWNQVLSDLNIKSCRSTAYHPQTDGQTERVNQILEQYLRCYTNDDQDNWADLLPTAQFAYNSATHASTKMSPFKANYGFDPSWDPKLDLPDNNAAGRDWTNQITKIHEICTKNLSNAIAAYKAFADQKRTQGKPLTAGDQV